MADEEGGQERVNGICAVSMPSWWWGDRNYTRMLHAYTAIIIIIIITAKNRYNLSFMRFTLKSL